MKRIIEEFKNPPVSSGVRIRYWLPEGMVNDVGIHKDLVDLRNRGIVGIEVVPFAVNHKDLKGKEWGSQTWYDGLESVLKHAKELDLKVDLAIGPQWPIAMPQIKDVDDCASLYELTYGISEDDYSTIPSPKVTHEKGTRKLIALMAYKKKEDHILIQDSYIDLMNNLQDGKISYPFDNNDYVIFAYYSQPSCHQVFNRYYVIDHYSKEGSDVCIDYWKEHLEPLIMKYPGVMESIFCDSLEFKVSMDWTRGFEEIFKQKYGFDLCPYLPVLKQIYTYPRVEMAGYRFENSEITEQITNCYMKLLSDLYIENHLKPLNNYARSIGLTLRYQVAYNKPISIEDSASVVDICENESLNRYSIDNLRTMAASVHLNGKKIYSSELNGEFGNCYGQTFKDILYFNKRAYMAGVNRQVLHGASYNGGYDTKYFTFPGFEPFGKFVSNYYNRTPSHSAMKTNMDFLSRNNYILQKEHVVDFLVYREEFINSGKGPDGNYILKDSHRLVNNGYSYDYVSPSLLISKQLQTKKYQGLIISDLDTISHLGLKAISQLKIPVYFINCNLHKPLYFNEVINDYQIKNAKSFKDMDEFVSYLANNKLYGDICYLNEVEIGSVHTKDDYANYYYFYNYNSVKTHINSENGKEEFDSDTIYPGIDKNTQFKKKDLDVILKGEGEVMVMHAINGHVYHIDSKPTSQGHQIHLTLDEDESIIIAIGPYHVTRNDPYHRPILEEICFDKYRLDIYEYVPCGPTFYDQKIVKSHKKSLDEVYGYGIYTFEVDLQKQTGADYILSFEDIDDTYRIKVNGQNIMAISSYPNVCITHGLVSGKNIIQVRVYTNLNNIITQNKKQHFGIKGKVVLKKV